MPFTVNVGPYQGGNFLASGIANLGAGIGKGFEQYQKAQQEEATDNYIIDYALKNKMLTPEQHQEFLQGNRQKKTGVVAGLVRSFAMDMQQQQADVQKQQIAASQQAVTASKAATDIAAAEEARKKAGDPYAFTPIYGGPQGTTQMGIFGPGGKPEYFPGTAIDADSRTPVDSTKATRLKDTDTGEDLPYYSVPLGPKQSQILGVPDQNIVRDPETGLYKIWNGKGYTVLPPQTQMQIKLSRGEPIVGGAAPSATPGASPSATVNQAQEQIAKSTPTPGATAAPSIRPGAKRPLTPDVAQRFLNQARAANPGADPKTLAATARQLATQAGY